MTNPTPQFPIRQAPIHYGVACEVCCCCPCIQATARVRRVLGLAPS